MSILSRACKRRNMAGSILKSLEKDTENVPLTLHKQMTAILMDIPSEKLHLDPEFETIAIIARSASIAGVWQADLQTVAEHRKWQVNVTESFKNRWQLVQENQNVTVVDFLELLTENEQLSFV